MHYDLKKPCSDCPFLRVGGIRLMQSRVVQIAYAMLDYQGATFACHKTTVDTDDGERGASRKTRHCAGGLIFMEKHGQANQMARIAERLRMYDHRALMSDKDAVASVFDSLEEMLKVNAEFLGGGR